MNLAAKLPPTPVLLPGAVLMVATLFLLTTLLVQGRALREGAVAAAAPSPAVGADKDAPLAPGKPASDLGMLANSALFGHFDPAKAAAGDKDKAAPTPAAATLGDKAPDALPEASLALKLQGIVFKKDPTQRRAIIAGDGPTPEARKIGETLLGSAVIRYIEARRVVVEQQGELKALTLIDPSVGNGAPPYGQAVPPMPGSPAAYAGQAPALSRSGMEGVPPAQAELTPEPEPEYEPPPEDSDGSVQYEEAVPPDDAVEVDQSEPAQ